MPLKARLDQGTMLDPIDLGLVSSEEAEMLLSLYVQPERHPTLGSPVQFPRAVGPYPMGS